MALLDSHLRHKLTSSVSYRHTHMGKTFRNHNNSMAEAPQDPIEGVFNDGSSKRCKNALDYMTVSTKNMLH